MFRDFDEFFPWRFIATTNGISPRRWLKIANPRLAQLVTEFIWRQVERDLCHLESLDRISRTIRIHSALA